MTALIIFAWLIVGMIVTVGMAARDQRHHITDQWLSGDTYAPQWVYVLFAVALGPVLLVLFVLRAFAAILLWVGRFVGNLTAKGGAGADDRDRDAVDPATS